MDVLEKYKEAWDNQDNDTKKVSQVEIYKMMKSKSSSIVKWIFIIGMIEFILLGCSYLFIDFEESNKIYDDLGIKNFVVYSQVVLGAIVIYYLYKFYINYRSISVTENTKSLMNQIVTTRRTVKNYVFINLGYLAIMFSVITTMSFKKFDDFSNMQTIGAIIGMVFFLAVILGLTWLFYQLIYGILLRKLYRNYKDLAKLDDE
ncbi:hypothetical protein [Tenacibaculum agarivorans]|uniref:hypothetical protein n=1 Tax=Tenacibaculum agarivorans TaxID=1908389 RepID=UPI00094BBBA7|nr:hypothetical protein [Tenacibaculum agarivorans]